MIGNFIIPSADAIAECLLSRSDNDTHDAAVLISTRQADAFYSDIFQFWVRAFFSFVENTGNGLVFKESMPFICCKKLDIRIFISEYNDIFNGRVMDDFFNELQLNSETRINLSSRSFLSAYSIINYGIRSMVASSNGEYVALFSVPDHDSLKVILKNE